MNRDANKLYHLAMLESDNNPDIEKEIDQLTAFADMYAARSQAPKAQNICGMVNVLRPDIVKDSFNQNSILSQAPSQKDGLIVVPAAIKNQ